jgi:predicted ATPase
LTEIADSSSFTHKHNEAISLLCSWLSISYDDITEIAQKSAKEQKTILFQVLKECLLSYDPEKPFLLVVEDIHWIDPTTTEFIEFLCKEMDQLKIMLLLTTRQVEKEPELFKNTKRIYLEPISALATGQIVNTILNGAPVEPGTLDYIVERTDGIPLYIEELTSMLLDREYITKVDGTYKLIPNIEDQSIPNTLQDLLNASLERMGSAKQTAQMAATIGREFDYALLCKVSAKDASDVQNDLLRLIDADLIFRQRRTKDEHYLFRHALIRDAAYEGMTHTFQREIHAKIAESIEHYFPENAKIYPFKLAEHYGKALNYERAKTHGLSAAEQSLKKSLNEEVLSISQKVIKWIDADKDTYRAIDELNIQCIQANALMTKYGWAADAVKYSVDRAFALMQTLGTTKIPTPELISSYWILFTYYHIASERDKVKVLTKELLELAKNAHDSVLEISAKTIEGIRLYVDGEFEDAITLLSSTLAQAQVNNDDTEINLIIGIDDLAYASSMLGQALWFSGQKKEGRQRADWAIERAKQIDHIPTYCLCLMYRIAINQFDGEKEAVQNTIGELLDTANKYDLGAYIPYALMFKYWAFDKVDSIDHWVNQLDAMGCRIALTQYLSFPAEYEFHHGEKEKALERIDKCLALCDKNKEYYFQKHLLQMKKKFMN